jgi:uncharacterized protein (DUF433 family)
MISSDPNIMMGKPVVAGTRVTVEAILEKMAGGLTATQILEAYPHLQHSDLTDALTFAAANLSAIRVLAVPQYV